MDSFHFWHFSSILENITEASSDVFKGRNPQLCHFDCSKWAGMWFTEQGSGGNPKISLDLLVNPSLQKHKHYCHISTVTVFPFCRWKWRHSHCRRFTQEHVESSWQNQHVECKFILALSSLSLASGFPPDTRSWKPDSSQIL